MLGILSYFTFYFYFYYYYYYLLIMLGVGGVVCLRVAGACAGAYVFYVIVWKYVYIITPNLTQRARDPGRNENNKKDMFTHKSFA